MRAGRTHEVLLKANAEALTKKPLPSKLGRGMKKSSLKK